jgi:hypothetical protein
LLFSRLGKPDETARERILKRFDPLFPTQTYEVNAELCQLLVYLEAPGVAEKALKLMATAVARSANGVRQVAAKPEDRLDAGAAQDLLPVVSEGGQLQVLLSRGDRNHAMFR